MEEYIRTIRRILGNEKFNKLSHELYEKVDKKYRKISIDDANEIVNFNLANILVIAIEKARGCEKKDIIKVISWYNLGPKSFLLEKQISNFEENYSEYIALIIKKVKEDKVLEESNI